MKRILFFAVVVIIPFLFSGCGKKQAATEKVPEQTVQKEANTSVTQGQDVAESVQAPLPQGEDVVRLFFNLINEKRIPEAVVMLDSSAVPNDSAKQAWGAQFNIFKSIAVESIEPSNIGGETENQKTYKVILSAQIDPGPAKMAIPNQGWVSGENIRWVSLKKNSEGLWKILGIGTGP